MFLDNSTKYQAYLVAIFAVLVRYYDYALFGLSASILAKKFFPEAKEQEQLLLFFTIFAISVLARPLGAIIFGKIGDQFGRVFSVKIATILAAIATILIGLLPSYQNIGVVAALLLTLCRMLFTVSLAGEVDGVKILITEKVGAKNRILAMGVISFFSQIGVLIASLMYYLAINSHNVDFLWRANFILGGVCGLIVFFFRDSLQESELFLRKKAQQKALIQPVTIWQLIRTQKLKFFLAMIISGSLGGFYHFLIIFLANFMASIIHIISPQQAALHNIILIIIYAVACLIAGFLSNRLSWLKSGYLSLLVSIIVTVALCLLYQHISIYLFLHKIMVFLIPFYSLSLNVKLQSIFPTEIRMRMFSLSHSLGSMFFSATTPLISMLIWRVSSNVVFVLSWLLILLLITLYALILINNKDYLNFFKTSL